MTTNYVIEEARKRVFQHRLYNFLEERNAWVHLGRDYLNTCTLGELQAVEKSLNLLLELETIDRKRLDPSKVLLKEVQEMSLLHPQTVVMVLNMFRMALGETNRVLNYANVDMLEIVLKCHDMVMQLPVLYDLSPKQIRIATSMSCEPVIVIETLVGELPFVISRDAFEAERGVIMSSVHQQPSVALMEYGVTFIWTAIWSVGLYWLVRWSGGFLHLDTVFGHNPDGGEIVYGLFIFQFVAIYVAIASLIGARLISGNHYLDIRRYAHIIFPNYEDKYEAQVTVEMIYSFFMMGMILSTSVQTFVVDFSGMYFGFLGVGVLSVFPSIPLLLVVYRTFIFKGLYCLFAHPAWKVHMRCRLWAHRLVTRLGW